MTGLGVVLFVLPFAWAAAVASLLLLGRAGRQGLFVGMISPKDSDSERSVRRGLRQQNAQGKAGRVLIRFWPLAGLSLIAGIVVLVAAS